MKPQQVELAVDLRVELADPVRGLKEGLASGVETGERIDELDARLAHIATVLGQPQQSRAEPTSPERAKAASLLESGRLDALEAELEAEISEASSVGVRARMTEFAPLRCKLDGLDLLVAGIAGTAAAAVDLFVVRIPRDVSWNDGKQTGSAVTGWLRDHAVNSDNWLAKMAQVPFDEMSGHAEQISGLGPRTHRVHTFGHDPLFGLVIGTLDIMRGTITGAGKEGAVGVDDTRFGGTSNPFAALCIEVMHLLSDLPTKTGLPLPGWAPLMTITSTIGGRPANEVAREAYLRGYSTTHLPAMMLPPLTGDAILRAYWHIRSHYDDEFRRTNDIAGDLLGIDSVSDHPRYRALALAVHGLAAGLNLAKLAAFGSNPLALNYAQWVAFFRALYRYTQTELLKPGATSDALYLQFHANRRDLADAFERAGHEAEVDASGAPDTTG